MKLRKFIERRGTLILFIFTIILFLSYTYDDMVTTQRHSILVWDALSKGQLTNFYQFCYDNKFGGANYDMTIYFIFAIWNLPCWIFERLTGQNAQNYELWITYGKGIVFFAYLWSVKLFALIYNKICDRSPLDDRPKLSVKSATIYYASSTLLLCYSVLSGNYDIISLVLILFGINAFLDDKKITFLIIFSVATSLKFFAALVFVPLLLLNEKRITRIIPGILSCFVISVLEDMIFHKSSVLASTNNTWFMAESGVSSFAQSGKIHAFGFGTVSLCILLYVLLCIYCYIQENDHSFLFFRKMIYVSVSAWLIFFLIRSFNCYWIVLMVPFLVLLVVTNTKHLFISTILELFFSVALYINCQIRQGWVLGRFYKHGLLKEVFISVFGFENFETGTLGAMIDMNSLNAKYPIDIFVNSVIVAVVVALLILHFPGRRWQESVTAIRVPSQKESICLTLRHTVSLFIATVPMLCYVYQMVVHNISF